MFFFKVGAGISCPSVPLAPELISLFRQEIERQGKEPPPLTGSVADDYGIHIDRAFRTAESRREFLSRLIAGREPSAANLALASLLGPEALSDLVVTTNFDGMVPAALRQKGEPPLVYDHPDTLVQRFRPRRRRVHVLEIHGTVEHYDFCNLQEEITGRAEKLNRMLYSLLVERSPIVVGYSGWEGDAFMTALRMRLEEAPGSFENGLFWFCYSQADADALPAWLKKDPSVRIVLPQGNGHGRLPAAEVFGAFQQALERVPTARRISSAVFDAAEDAVLRDEPMEALKELRFLNTADLTAGQRAHLRAVLQHIYLRNRETNPAVALEACDFWAAEVRQVDGTLLLGGHLREQLAWSLYGAGVSLLGLQRRAEAKARFEEVLALGSEEDPWLTGRAAQARNGVALVLFGEGRSKEALQLWKALVLSTKKQPDVQEAAAYALFNLGLACQKLGKQAEAADHWRSLVDRFADEVAPQVRELRNRALRHLAEVCTKSDIDRARPELAYVVYTSGDTKLGNWVTVAEGLRSPIWMSEQERGDERDDLLYTPVSAGEAHPPRVRAEDSRDVLLHWRGVESVVRIDSDFLQSKSARPEHDNVTYTPGSAGDDRRRTSGQPCESPVKPRVDDKEGGSRTLAFPRSKFEPGFSGPVVPARRRPRHAAPDRERLAA